MNEINPALTTDEWKRREFGFETWGRVHLHEDGALEVRDSVNQPALLRGEERHRIAALALYGQPFGFTQADVELLRDLEDAPDDQRLAVEPLRKRIEALLPPEKP